MIDRKYLSGCVDDFQVEFPPSMLILGQHSICCSGKQMIIRHILPGAKERILRHLLVDLVEKKVNEREHKEMESLIDNAVACIEDDKENQEWVFAADETLYPPPKRHHLNDVEGVAFEASVSPVLLDRNAVLH